MRPGSSFENTLAAIRRLTARGHAPQLVFVPSRFNIHEAVAAYDLSVRLGCEAFVTGPMMRIGRAATAWDAIACTDGEWQKAADALRERAAAMDAATGLSI
jgi:MoaA/NifB/PqqE/SkfB family radical SAM enzyme